MTRQPGRQPQRVAFVSAYYAPRIGGVESHTQALVQAVRDRSRFRPVVITTAGDGRRAGVSSQDGVEIHRLPAPFTLSNTPLNPAWLWQVPAALRRAEADLVVAQAPVPGLADLALLTRGRRPGLLTFHSGSMVKGDSRFDPLIRGYEQHVLPRVFRRTSKLVACSSTALGADRPGAEVITPGVDVERFRPDPTLPESQRHTILFVGRLERSSAWKGVDTLLDAFARAHAAMPDLTLRLVGTGDAVPDLRAKAEALGVLPGVDFAGALHGADLVRAYQQALVLVLPSLTDAESFGMTVVEAMACGRPVIGSRVGGVPGVIGRSGTLVPPGDPVALGDAINALAGDPDRRQAEGAQNRTRAVQEFSWRVRTDRYLELFEELLEAAPGQRRVSCLPPPSPTRSAPVPDRIETS